MERNLEIKLVKTAKNSFDAEVYAPECGDFKRFSFEFGDRARLCEEIGNEIYSWVALMMDEEED